jgi:peroxiredoxin Q/BCP
VGISTDSVEKLAKQYPGKIPVLGVANRATYVIGQDGLVKEIITGGAAIDPSTAVAACPLKH